MKRHLLTFLVSLALSHAAIAQGPPNFGDTMVPNGASAPSTTATPIVLPSALGTPTMIISDVRWANNTTIGCEIVQRADGATMTVGWLNDVCDKAAADRFASGTALTILTKLDQSGNSNNCTNATAATQPNYTALNEQNGVRPTSFSGTITSATVLAFLQCPSTINRTAVTVYDVEANRVSLSNGIRWEFDDAGFTTPYVQLYTPGAGTTGLSSNYGVVKLTTTFPRANPNVTSYSLSGTLGYIVRTNNGVQTSSIGTPTSQAVGGFQIGKSISGTSYNAATDLYAIVIYGAAHTAVQMQSVEAVLNTSFNIPLTFRNRIVYGGSSLITSAFATLNQQAPWQGAFGRSSTWETYIMAVFGQTLATEFANRANYTGLFDGTKAANVVVIDAPSNDVAAATFTSAADAQQWASDFYGSTNTARATNTTLPFVTALKAAGFTTVVAPTIIARGTWDTTTNWKETARLAYNTLVVNGALAGGYVASNRAGNSFFSTPAATSNAACYQADLTHLTNFCYGVLESIDSPAIGPGGFLLERDLGGPANDNEPAFQSSRAA